MDQRTNHTEEVIGEGIVIKLHSKYTHYSAIKGEGISFTFYVLRNVQLSFK